MSTTDTTCTCPSGDGSLRWPCPTHPPTERDERLRGIQERATAATEGPWATAHGKRPRLFGINGPDDYVTLHDGTLQEVDAAFIAAARTDVPWLLAEVARLDAVVTAVRALAASPYPDVLHPRVVLVRDLLRALDGGA